MPFPGHHAARIQSPNRFDKDAYRTVAGGTIYGGRIKVPQTVNVIWGKLIGKAKPSDPPILQSLRFDIKHWTETEARKWLKDNEIKFILFEPAEEKKEASESEIYIKIPVPQATKEEQKFFEEHGICDLSEIQFCVTDVEDLK